MKCKTNKFRLAAMLTGFILASAPPAFAEFSESSVEIGIFKYSLDSENSTAAVIGGSYGDEQDVTIPATVKYQDKTYTVTQIGKRGEYYLYFRDINSVTIPASVTTISELYVDRVNSFAIPNSVTTIGELGVSNIESITIPASVTNCNLINAHSVNNVIFEDSEKILTTTNGISVQVNKGGTLHYGRNFRLDKQSESDFPRIKISGYCDKLSIGKFVATFATELNESGNQSTATLATKELIIDDSDKPLNLPLKSLELGQYEQYAEVRLEKVYIGRDIVYPYSDSGISSALAYRQNLKEVTLSNNVTAILFEMFAADSALAKIELPASVKAIGADAFNSCTSLTSISIPEGVTEIPKNAFATCSSLVAADIPSTVESIGENAFMNCHKLKAIELPSGLKSLSQNAFRNCYEIVKIELPAGITELQNSIFANCTSLKEINIPAGVKTFGEGVFSNCGALQSITIPENLALIGKNAFTDCSSLTEISLPKSVASIGESVFSGCSSLAKVELSPTISIIPQSAFLNCAALKDISLSDNISVIQGYAFSGCSSLKELTIPGNVKELGFDAFSACTGISKLTLADSHNSTDSEDSDNYFSIRGNSFADSPITFLYLGRQLYTEYDENKRFPHVEKAIVSGTAKSIPGGIFTSNKNLTEIEIQEGVEIIETSAFEDCSFSEIKLPSTITAISSSAFKNCAELTSIEIPESISGIDMETFAGCKKLEKVVLPSKLSYISNRLFSGCESLASINIPVKVDEIYSGAFENCTKLTSITLPEATTYVGNEAFSGCTSLNTIRVLNPKPFEIYSDSFDNSAYENAKLCVPVGSKDEYAKADVWYRFMNIDEYVPATLEIIDTPESIEAGMTATITPVVKNADDETFSFTFTSENEKIATVDNNGVITGVSSGRTKIFVNALGSKGTTISANFIITITPSASVDGIDAENSIVTVFNLNGIECYKGVRSEMYDRLPAGLYIIVENGVARKEQLR